MKKRGISKDTGGLHFLWLAALIKMKKRQS